MIALDHIKEIEASLLSPNTNRDDFVVQSWKRCIDQFGLDPSRPSPAYIVPETQLKIHREQSERLIGIARFGLEELFRQVVGQNYVLLLADADGVTVDFFGDMKLQEELRPAGLHLGADWSEAIAGTCGVGSCIATGEALVVHQSDHFDLHHIPLSCTAAPIYDPNGSLAAVLSISLLQPPRPKISQMLGLQLVKASARRIEMANLMAMTRSEWVLRFSHMPEFLDIDPEAAVAFDSTGRILGMTHQAEWRLSEVETERKTLVGSNINDVFDLTMDDLPNFTRARPPEDRVIHLRNGAALFGHAIAPQDSNSIAISNDGLPDSLRTLSGDDPAMRAIEKRAAKLSHNMMPVLITGDSGTGKEKLARAMHRVRDPKAPFVVVNCADISNQLLDSALFGDGVGAQGLIEAAHNGTLFFDEIAEMPASVQARLARTISDGEIRSIGSAHSVPIRAKIISATSYDITKQVHENTFRQDLLFRLAATTLELPSLNRRTDFNWLVDRLLKLRTISKPVSYKLTNDARIGLKRRNWPGNIRELINVLDVAIALCEGNIIDLDDLPAPLLIETPPELPDDKNDLSTMLEMCDWNLARAARHLGVDRSTVHRRMKREGLSRPKK